MRRPDDCSPAFTRSRQRFPHSRATRPTLTRRSPSSGSLPITSEYDTRTHLRLVGGAASRGALCASIYDAAISTLRIGTAYRRHIRSGAAGSRPQA